MKQPRNSRGLQGSQPEDSTLSADERAWSAFVAECRALLAIPPELMSPEQLDRLEAISDAFLHLVGYANAIERRIVPEQDQRLAEELTQRKALERRRRVAPRWAGSPGVSDPDKGLLTDVEREALRERILAGLHARQLRVREAEAPPNKRAMTPTRVPTLDLLRELEVSHQAVLVPELAIAAGAGHELWDIECTTTVDVPPELPRGPYLALGVVGDSMEPLLHSGDTVLVRVDEKAEPGTVVVARDPDHGYVVKEVVRLTAHGIDLRSLNPAFPSLRVPHRAGAVLGTVVLRWPRSSLPGESRGGGSVP